MSNVTKLIAERDEVTAQLVEEILADEKKGQQP